MRAGRIVQTGTPQELYDQPNSRYVADFVGTSNFFDGVVKEITGSTATIELAGGRSYKSPSSGTISDGNAACLSVRPEQIRLHLSQTQERLEGRVLNRIFLGEHTEYLIRQESLGNITVLAPRQSDEGLSNLGTGDTVYLDWSADAALILPKD